MSPPPDVCLHVLLQRSCLLCWTARGNPVGLQPHRPGSPAVNQRMHGARDMCVCMYVYACMCVCMHVYACMCVCMHVFRMHVDD